MKKSDPRFQTVPLAEVLKKVVAKDEIAPVAKSVAKHQSCGSGGTRDLAVSRRTRVKKGQNVQASLSR